MRHLKATYHDDRRQFVMRLGMELFKSVQPTAAANDSDDDSGGAGGSGGSGGGGSDDDDDPPPYSSPGGAAAARQLVPVAPKQSVPMAELLERFAPKRKAAGACR